MSIEQIEGDIYECRFEFDDENHTLSIKSKEIFLDDLKSLSRIESAKVLILKGGNNVFCAGGDFDFLCDLKQNAEHLSDIVTGILNVSIPVIAQLDGHAIGGGFAIALYCDILVASDRKRFGFNFSDLGFTPGMGTTRLLSYLTNPNFAFEMLSSAKLYRGRELQNKNLFNHIVDDKSVASLTLDLARRLSEKPSYVLKSLKKSQIENKIKILGNALIEERKMHDFCFSKAETMDQLTQNYNL